MPTANTDCDCTVCAYAKKHPQTGARRCWYVTADTITDEQIRELRTWAMQNSRYDVAATITYALKPRTRPKSVRLDARVRCAEIWNQRGGSR